MEEREEGPRSAPARRRTFRFTTIIFALCLDTEAVPGARCRAQAEPTGRTLRQHCRSLGEGGGVPVGRGLSQWWSTVTPPAARRVRLRPPLLLQQPRRR